MEQSYSYMTLRDYLRVLFRHKAVVVTSIITVTATVIVGLIFKTNLYKADVKMLVQAEKQVESPYYRELVGYSNIQLALTQSEIVKSNAVLGLAVRALGLYQRPLDYEKNFSSIFKKPFIKSYAAIIEATLKKYTPEQRREILYRTALEDLKLHIKVEPLRDTNLFVISVMDFSPVGAAIIANTVSRAYAIFDLQQQLSELQLKYGEKHPTAVQLKENIDKLTKKLTGEPLPDMEAIGPAAVKIVEQASIPIRPDGLPKLAILVLGFIMSIFLGVMLAFLSEYLDQSLKSPKEVEEYLGVPYLGSIPKGAKVNYYHDLADQIYLLLKDKKLKTLMLASALPGEGVTTTVVNLGSYLSRTAGHKVLLIDANLRNPSLQKFFKSGEQGLVDVLEGKISFERAIKDCGSNLSVLSAGRTELNPITLLGSHTMGELIKDAKEKFQIVLIDTAELCCHKDAAVLSPFVDGVAIVINEGKTRRQVVKSFMQPLELNKANIIGAILNNRVFHIPENIYKRI